MRPIVIGDKVMIYKDDNGSYPDRSVGTIGIVTDMEMGNDIVYLNIISTCMQGYSSGRNIAVYKRDVKLANEDIMKTPLIMM